MEEESALSAGDQKETATADYQALQKLETAESKHEFAITTALGVLKNPKRLSVREWIFLIVATLSMLAALSLTIVQFVLYKKNIHNLTYHNNNVHLFQCSEWICSTQFVFVVQLLVNLLFCSFYCYDGIFRERLFELLAFGCAALFILVYLIGRYMYYSINQKELSVVMKVQMALAIILAPIIIVLVIWNCIKIGYLTFHIIGCKKELVRAYHIRSFFITSQYFHVEILVNIAILSFAQNVTLLSTAERVILALHLIYLCAAVFFGAMAVLWETKVGVVIWYILMVPFILYYFYRLIKIPVHWFIYTTEFEEYHTNGEVTSATLEYVGVSLLVAVSLGMVTVLVLMICMIFVLQNFNTGLKKKVSPPLKSCVEQCSKYIR